MYLMDQKSGQYVFPLLSEMSSNSKNTVNADIVVACVFLMPGVLTGPHKQCS